MSQPIKCDVLVVGGGPTGVTLGLLLGRGGVETLVVDKEADIYPAPRAAHIDHEIVRILQELGVANEVMATTRCASRYDFLTAAGEVLLRFEGANRIGPGGWPASNMIHQPSVEAALRSAAARQPHLQLKTGWNWISCEERGGRVASRIESSGGEQIVLSRHIVGCDGSRSPVRTAAGIEVDDLQFDEPWLVVDVLVKDPDRLPKANLQICDPARPTTCVLMGAGRHRWEFMLKRGETPEQVTDDAFVSGLLRPWNVEGAVTIERKAVYRFNAKVAKTWRKGPLMLAGDAAHQMPPFAGQGMCSGIRDAANLAWKLIAITCGASETLLDTYQPEREPLVRSIIRTAMMMGRMVCTTDPDAARARDEEMLSARAAGKAPNGSLANPPLPDGCIMKGAKAAGAYFPQPIVASTPAQRLDDVLGPGSWLIVRSAADRPTVDRLRTLAIDEDALKLFRKDVEGWMAKHDADAVLIRPDHYVFGAGRAEDLQTAWAQWMS